MGKMAVWIGKGLVVWLAVGWPCGGLIVSMGWLRSGARWSRGRAPVCRSRGQSHLPPSRNLVNLFRSPHIACVFRKRPFYQAFMPAAGEINYPTQEVNV